jgi:YidC/Oxa1 family membrane protein insertase
MIALAGWQGLLNGLGWILSHIYDLVGNYGAAIILLTLAIRILLLPLALKQIKSMQAMQSIQPQMKQLQQKYKGNRQKLNEEMMKLYKERGVNPLAGCLPMVLQIPVLISLYSVLRFPQHPPHLPDGSALRQRIEVSIASDHPNNPANFLGMNLLCNAQQAGSGIVKQEDRQAKSNIHLNCGDGIPVRIPYYVLGLLMVGSMFYQQRQMQRAAPPGQSAQQQMLTRILPLISVFWGFIVPSGVILYWTTSNLVQIGQQYFLLRAGHIGQPPAGDGKKGAAPAKGGDGDRGATKALPAKTTPPAARTGGARRAASAAPQTERRGFFASMLERAEAERARRSGQAPPAKAEPPSANPDGSASTPARTQSPPQRKPTPGGGNARNRKKRRKR